MDWTEHLEKAARGKVSRGEPMSRHTTFGVGGPADVFFEPLDEEDLRNALRLLSLEGVRRAIIGRGANLLFSDEGYGGCVIRIGKGLGSIDYDGRTVKLGAGVSLQSAVVKLAEKGLCGLENLAGIPGTIGGAVWMNAGAFGRSISSCITNVRAVGSGGEELSLEKEALAFGYRKSFFQENPDLTIVGAEIETGDENPAAIKEKIKGMIADRKRKQPWGARSAGSFFRNPPGAAPAGALIDQAGLKGLSSGGARVSSVHANFIINTGGATCSDVLSLADEVRKRVFAFCGVELEPEVKLLLDGSF